MPWRTVKGNVEIQLELRGLPLDDYHEKIRSCCKQCI